MTEPKKFRKKPVVIDAIQYAPQMDITEPITRRIFEEFVGKRLKISLEFDGDSWWLEIPTLEGNHYARPGDWIIKGVKGECYPCKPDIFEATYEAVSD